MEILILNFIFYLSLIWLSFRKNGRLTAYTYICIIFALVSFFSILIYDTDYYAWGKTNQWGSRIRNELSLIPILYIGGTFLLFTQPLRKIDNIKILHVTKISNKVENILYVSSVVLLILIVLFLKDSASDVTDFSDAYMISREENTHDFSTYLRIINIGITPFILAFVFYLMSSDVRKYKKSILLLFLFLVSNIIQSVISGSRGSLILNLLNWAFAFIICKDLIGKRIRIGFLVLAGVFSMLVISYFLMITYDRFGEFEAIYWIASYIGEPFINFPLVLWDPPQYFYGGYMFDKLFNIGTDVNSATYEVYLFKTFAGSAYIDFGLVGGIVFIYCLSITMGLLVRVKSSFVKLEDLLLLMFLGNIYTMSVFSLTFNGWSYYVLVLIIYIYLRFFSHVKIGRK